MDTLYGRNKEEHPEPIKAEVQGKWEKIYCKTCRYFGAFRSVKTATLVHPWQHWKGKLRERRKGVLFKGLISDNICDPTGGFFSLHEHFCVLFESLFEQDSLKLVVRERPGFLLGHPFPHGSAPTFGFSSPCPFPALHSSGAPGEGL